MAQGNQRWQLGSAGSMLLLHETQEVLAVVTSLHRRSEPREILAADVLQPVGNFLDAANHEALPFFNDLHEVRSLDE